MRQVLLISIVGVLILTACSRVDELAERAEPTPPLGDTLVSIYEALVAAATTDRSETFRDLLVESEAERLERVRRGYGAVSLGWCLERQLGSWPDPDTLVFGDLICDPPYARVSFLGPGAYAAYNDCVRYTFLLFRQSESGWRLAGASSLDKDRYDRYGAEQSYLETELPSRLRFPRLF